MSVLTGARKTEPCRTVLVLRILSQVPHSGQTLGLTATPSACHRPSQRCFWNLWKLTIRDRAREALLALTRDSLGISLEVLGLDNERH